MSRRSSRTRKTSKARSRSVAGTGVGVRGSVLRFVPSVEEAVSRDLAGHDPRRCTWVDESVCTYEASSFALRDTIRLAGLGTSLARGTLEWRRAALPTWAVPLREALDQAVASSVPRRPVGPRASECDEQSHAERGEAKLRSIAHSFSSQIASK